MMDFVLVLVVAMMPGSSLPIGTWISIAFIVIVVRAGAILANPTGVRSAKATRQSESNMSLTNLAYLQFQA